jgi:hypothetical protein
VPPRISEFRVRNEQARLARTAGPGERRAPRIGTRDTFTAATSDRISTTLARRKDASATSGGTFFGLAQSNSSGSDHVSVGPTATLGSRYVHAGVQVKVPLEAGQLAVGATPLAWAESGLRLVARDGDRVCLEQGRTRLLGLAVIASFTTGWLGGGVRVMGARLKDLSLRRWMSRSEAQALLTAEDTRGNLVRSRLVGLGWVKPRLPAPDLDHPLGPDGLRIGDELRATAIGTFVGGGALALGPAVFGIQGMWSGESEISAERIDEHQVRVRMMPRRVTRGVCGALTIPLIAETSLSAARVRWNVYEYLLDVSHPEAAAALPSLLRGQPLPRGQLPPGVSLLLEEQGRVPCEQSRQAVLPLPRYVPWVKLSGFGNEKLRSHEELTRRTPEGVRYLTTHSKEKRHERAHRGTTSRVTAQTVGTDGRAIQTELSTHRGHPKERNRMVRWLNEGLEEPIPFFDESARKTGMAYTVRQLGDEWAVRSEKPFELERKGLELEVRYSGQDQRKKSSRSKKLEHRADKLRADVESDPVYAALDLHGRDDALAALAQVDRSVQSLKPPSPAPSEAA